MSRKLYRICLLSIAVIAIVGGIFYYLNHTKDEPDTTDGTLVWHMEEPTVDNWES